MTLTDGKWILKIGCISNHCLIYSEKHQKHQKHQLTGIQMAPRRGKIAKRAIARHKMMVENDDSTSVESTATATNESACRHIEKDNGLEMHGTENETAPAGNEILLSAVDDQDKSLSMLTETYVDNNGMLSIIQKSMTFSGF
jgi:hypothetical protein